MSSLLFLGNIASIYIDNVNTIFKRTDSTQVMQIPSLRKSINIAYINMAYVAMSFHIQCLFYVVTK